jgi:hypothetical protein
MENVKISISYGNSKMGKIPSVSLPPVVTCQSGCTCAKKCYAVKLCRIYKNVKQAYDRNLDIFYSNPVEYWKQINDVLSVSRFFRYHVSGDIVSYDYFAKVVESALNNPNCDILMFTKKYYIVNSYIFNHGTLPKNLHVIFSEWDGMFLENPYNLPVSRVIFRGNETPENANICTGNCLECAKNNRNCWNMKNGESVYFHEH